MNLKLKKIQINKPPVKIIAGFKTITIYKEQIIPLEYKQLEYLESTGTQYINAIPLFDNRIRVYIDFAIDKYIHDTWICGVYNSYYGALFGLGMLNNQLYKHHPDVEYNPDILQIGTIISGSCFCDNYNSLYLFARSQAFTEDPSGCFKGKIYHAKVIQWDNQETMRDMYPCIRKSDNKPGMYDMATGAFYTNSGTGEFLIP